jgi:hypothetical protein
MGLTLRPTGLGSPVDKDRRDYTVFSGEFAMGQIYEERGAPADLHGSGRSPAFLARHRTRAWMATRRRSNRQRHSSGRTGGSGWHGQS